MNRQASVARISGGARKRVRHDDLGPAARHECAGPPSGRRRRHPQSARRPRRFDRLPDGSAVHIEDFTQVFGVYPRDKYKNASARSIARVLGAEGGDADIVEFVRRLTFSTLIGNADAHLKNWSLIYPDRRRAALAPAYDLLSTVACIPDENAALKFSRTRRFDQFSADDLSHLAAQALLPERLVLETAHETVALFHQHWQSEKKNLPLSAEVVQVVETHLKSEKGSHCLIPQ